MRGHQQKPADPSGDLLRGDDKAAPPRVRHLSGERRRLGPTPGGGHLSPRPIRVSLDGGGSVCGGGSACGGGSVGGGGEIWSGDDFVVLEPDPAGAIVEPLIGGRTVRE